MRCARRAGACGELSVLAPWLPPWATPPDLDVPAGVWVFIFLVLPFLAGVIAGYLGRWLADRLSRHR